MPVRPSEVPSQALPNHSRTPLFWGSLPGTQHFTCPHRTPAPSPALLQAGLHLSPAVLLLLLQLSCLGPQSAACRAEIRAGSWSRCGRGEGEARKGKRFMKGTVSGWAVFLGKAVKRETTATHSTPEHCTKLLSHSLSTEPACLAPKCSRSCYSRPPTFPPVLFYKIRVRKKREMGCTGVLGLIQGGQQGLGSSVLWNSTREGLEEYRKTQQARGGVQTCNPSRSEVMQENC